MLYALDNCKLTATETVDFFSDRLPTLPTYKKFTQELFDGVYKNMEQIDEVITKYAQNWELSRMPSVDRNITRIAVYEMMHNRETPINVIIDEAVEIAKKYSKAESSKFINAVLDRIKVIRIKKSAPTNGVL
jgi:N utilization substance protein B